MRKTVKSCSFKGLRRPNPVFSDEYQAIREVIISARLEAGLTQREVARRLDKAASHVSLIERGERRIDMLEGYRFACLVGLPFSDFADRIAERLRQSTLERGSAVERMD